MNYKSFKVKELFDIHPTKAYKLTNPQLFCDNGKVPVVTNTSETFWALCSCITKGNNIMFGWLKIGITRASIVF